MHDDFDIVFCEDLGHGATVAEVLVEEGDVFSDSGSVSIYEVIEDKGGMASCLELSDAVAPYIPCTSDYENVHGAECDS